MKRKHTGYPFLGFLTLSFTTIAKDLSEQNQVVLSEKVLERCREKSPYKEYLAQDDMPTNWLERLKEWLLSLISSNINDDLWGTIIEVTLYTVALTVVVLIVMKLSGISLTSLRKPKSKDTSTLSVFDEDTPIGSINFVHLIEQAIKDDNYRHAIRYSFLLVLQTLDNKDYIEWEKEKSNFDYLLCMKSTQAYPAFKVITQIYEEAWYGEMPWTDEQYFSHYLIMKEQIQVIDKKEKAV